MRQLPILDMVILHYVLRSKKHMIELSKSVQSAYFEPYFQGFYSLLNAAFLDPNIKEVLSADAFLDYCEAQKASSQLEAFRTIYTDAVATRINGNELPDGDFPFYLQKFKERYNAILAEEAMRNIAAALNEGRDIKEINKIYFDAIKEINSINKGKVFDEGSLGEDIVNIYKEYEAIRDMPEQFRGITVGMPTLDNITNGFFGGELIIVASSEGLGKSTLVMNWAVAAWLGSNFEPWFDQDHSRTEGILENFNTDGHNIVYFTLEMPRSNRGKQSSAAYLNKRLAACVAGVEFSEIRKGTLSPANLERFKLACKFIKRYDREKKFYVVDIPRGATIEDLEVKYLEIKEKFQVDMVVVDYIGLMAGTGDEADWEAQGHLAEQLHEFARVYNVPVITPVQVNRPAGTGQSLNKQSYNTTRIGRSAMIGQNANMVFQIGCRDQEEQYTDMPLYTLKMRDGPKTLISLNKDFGKMRIYDGQQNQDTAIDLNEFVDLGPDEEVNDGN